MIEKPVAISTRPKPMLQRRSNPVNGSVLALVSVVGVVLVFAGATSLDGVLVVGVLDSLDGNVPVVGVVVGVLGVVVGVVVFGAGVVLP